MPDEHAHDAEGHRWQVDVWNEIADVYETEIDQRFVPVVDHLLGYARLEPGEDVVDLGTGTGAVAIAAAEAVGERGSVTGVDISPDMLDTARRRAGKVPARLEFLEGRAEAIPIDDASADVVLASLSLMYVLDRRAAAGEIARVLRPGGRFVSATWAGPDENDIVAFQVTAGGFAPPPPVPGVGPGSMADLSPFMADLADAGLEARWEKELPVFEFGTFEAAWDALAGVTTAALDPEIQEQAKAAVREAMWPDPNAPRVFRNATHYIVARKPGREPASTF